MGLLKSFFSQCARPKGSLGRVMLSFMNYTHAPLTNWGLKLVNIQDGWTMLDDPYSRLLLGLLMSMATVWQERG